MTMPPSANQETTTNEERWRLGAAGTAGLLAMLAGVIALLASQHANLAIRHQIQATSAWSHFQAESIGDHILQNRVELLNSSGQRPAENLLKRSSEYEKEKDVWATRARNLENETQRCIHLHDTFSSGLTFYHVAIALAMLSLMTRRRIIWFASLSFGGVGCSLLLKGLLSA